MAYDVAGAIKGNIVSNTINLYVGRLLSKTTDKFTIESCRDEVIALHKDLEAMDILAMTKPDNKNKPDDNSFLINSIEGLNKALDTVKDVDALHALIKSNYEFITSFEGEEKETISNLLTKKREAIL